MSDATPSTTAAETVIPTIPVSVCMLVCNEEDRLPRTLQSLTDGAVRFAEILVIDTGSTDDSVALCEAAGCRVIIDEWEGFAVMRKRAFEAASQPWIFWLDADEALTPELQSEFNERFGSSGIGRLKNIDGLEINRISQVEDRWIRHGDWFPDWNLRVFRAEQWSMTERLVHESASVEGPVERMSGLLRHYTFRGWDDFERRSLRYATLWAEQERARGRRTGPCLPTLRAAARFLRGYFIKGGLLDGVVGLKLAMGIAREVRLKHSMLRGDSSSPGGASVE